MNIFLDDSLFLNVIKILLFGDEKKNSAFIENKTIKNHVKESFPFCYLIRKRKKLINQPKRDKKKRRKMGEDNNLELPDVLKKLEIFPSSCLQSTSAPTASINRTNDDNNLPLTFNPFYCEGIAYHDKIINKQSENIKKIFGDKCIKCSCRNNINRIEHKIIKQTLFKRKYSTNGGGGGSGNASGGGRILKEPILKSIQNCIHYSHIRHKKLNSSVLQSNNDNMEDLSDCPNLDALNLEEEEEDEEYITTKTRNVSISSATSVNNEENNLDFHQLAGKFDIVILSDPTRYKLNGSNELYNFTTMQTYDRRMKNNNNCEKSKKFYENNKVSQELKLEQNNNASASSSCAQQARITATAGAAATTTCDVTIDELASYFETFVHIPKKMSTMAEMMYI